MVPDETGATEPSAPPLKTLEEALDMKILGMGVPELVIILAVVLLIFGPKNLPKLGGAIGKTVKNLREGMGGGDKNIVEADDEEEVIEEVEEPVKKTTAAKKTTTAAKKKAE